MVGMTRASALYEVVRLTRPIVLNSARAVGAGVAEERITVGGRAVLELLHDSGALTVPQIARRLDLARQGVQRLANDLESVGHLAQQPNPDHKRSSLYTLTATGRELFERVHGAELDQLGQVARKFSADDIAAAHRVLAALDESLRERAGDQRYVRPEG